MELAQGMEAADHSSKRLKGQEQHIKKVIEMQVRPQNSPQSCYRCRKSNTSLWIANTRIQFAMPHTSSLSFQSLEEVQLSWKITEIKEKDLWYS